MKKAAISNFAGISFYFLLLAAKQERFNVTPVSIFNLSFCLAIYGIVMGALSEILTCGRSNRLRHALRNLGDDLENQNLTRTDLIVNYAVFSGFQAFFLFSIPVTAEYVTAGILSKKKETFSNSQIFEATPELDPMLATFIGIAVGYITLLLVNRIINAVSNRCCPSYVASVDQTHLGESRRLNNLAASEGNENAEGEAPGYGAVH